MNAILAIAAKDLRLLLRDRMGFFFIFFFPLLYAFFFGAIFGGGDGPSGKMAIVVVDQDHTEASQEFIASLKADDALGVQTMAELRDAAGPKTPQIDDAQWAEALVRAGKRVAYVRIPEGFGTASRRILWGESMHLDVGVDPSRRAESAMLTGLLTAHAYEPMQELFTDNDRMRETADEAIQMLDQSDSMSATRKAITKAFLLSLRQYATELPSADPAEPQQTAGPLPNFNPVEITTTSVALDTTGRPRSSFAISFPQGMAWGLMGSAAGFGISLVVERTRGTLTRLRTAPIGSAHILAGKALACYVTTIGVCVTMLIIGRFVGVVPRSLPLLAMGILCAAFAFTGIMMFLSVLGRTEAAAGGIGWAVLIVMAMTGGGMVPVIFMKGWMVTLSNISPVKWTIIAIEGGIWRPYTAGQMLLPCSILLAVGFAGLAIGAVLFRRLQDA
jgi:ABC-2 type transport system permease protein